MPEPKLALFFEHPDWFRPLFRVLDRRGLPYRAIQDDGFIFDPAALTPPAPVLWSRMSPSAYLRSAEHGLWFAEALIQRWELSGARVLNGSRAYAFDRSKAAQLALLRSLGVDAPTSRVIHRVADAPKAAEDLRFPVLVKANVGGAGAGITSYPDMNALRAAAADGEVQLGVDGVALVQEQAPKRGGVITRVETIGGEVLYAVEVTAADGVFDLCPADVCQIDGPADGPQFRAVDLPEDRAEEVRRIVRAAEIDVGGVEFLVDDRDGRVLYYDVNAVSNFVAEPDAVLGYDPHEALADFLMTVVAATCGE